MLNILGSGNVWLGEIEIFGKPFTYAARVAYKLISPIAGCVLGQSFAYVRTFPVAVLVEILKLVEIPKGSICEKFDTSGALISPWSEENCDIFNLFAR